MIFGLGYPDKLNDSFSELKNDQLLPFRLSRSLGEVWRLIFEEFKKAFNLLTKADKFIFLKKWSPNADTPWN